MRKLPYAETEFSHHVSDAVVPEDNTNRLSSTNGDHQSSRVNERQPPTESYVPYVQYTLIKDADVGMTVET